MRNIDFKIIDNASGDDITIPVLSSIMGKAAGDIRDSGIRIVNVILQKGGVEAMDVIKRLTLASIGAANLTREKVEAMFEELVKKGEMTSDEKAEAIKHFVDRSEETAKRVKERTEDLITKFTEKFSSKVNEQIAHLSQRVEELNAKIAEIERQIAKS
jgi:polyhydroxyalkanoate synthesis regulator phasin